LKEWAGADGDTPLAGGIDTLWPIGLDQGQHTRAGAEALLRMGTVGHHHLAEGGDAWPRPGCLRQYSGRDPFGKAAMCGGHVVGHGRMVAPPRGAHMARNPLATLEYPDCLATCANIDFLFDQGEGDGIPEAVDFDVMVRCYAGALPPGEDMGFRWQGLQIGPVQRGEQIGAAGAIAAHHAHVQLIQKPPDRHVQFGR